MKLKLIGITGAVGSGKTTVARILEENLDFSYAVDTSHLVYALDLEEESRNIVDNIKDTIEADFIRQHGILIHTTKENDYSNMEGINLKKGDIVISNNKSLLNFRYNVNELIPTLEDFLNYKDKKLEG